MRRFVHALPLPSELTSRDNTPRGGEDSTNSPPNLSMSMGASVDGPSRRRSETVSGHMGDHVGRHGRGGEEKDGGSYGGRGGGGDGGRGIGDVERPRLETELGSSLPSSSMMGIASLNDLG